MGRMYFGSAKHRRTEGRISVADLQTKILVVSGKATVKNASVEGRHRYQPGRPTLNFLQVMAAERDKLDNPDGTIHNTLAYNQELSKQLGWSYKRSLAAKAAGCRNLSYKSEVLPTVAEAQINQGLAEVGVDKSIAQAHKFNGDVLVHSHTDDRENFLKIAQVFGTFAMQTLPEPLIEQEHQPVK